MWTPSLSRSTLWNPEKMQDRIFRKTWHIQCESKNHPPLQSAVFWHFYKHLRILNQFFHTYYAFLSTLRLQIFIHLSPNLKKLYHIKRDYLVHIICSKCPPSAETHTFRRLRKSLMALLTVVCGKSSQICCFYNVSKHVGYDMSSTVTSCHLLSKQT